MTTYRSSTGPAFGLCAALLTGPAPAQDAPGIALPSGAEVTLLDVITNVPGGGLTYRFRFLAPHIADPPDDESTAADMQFLCDTYALPRLSSIGPQPGQIIITLLDRPVVFGELVIEAIQFFELYRPGPEACVWENF